MILTVGGSSKREYGIVGGYGRIDGEKYSTYSQFLKPTMVICLILVANVFC